MANTSERHQVAALPWRNGSEGIEILLVTSRETRRWVTPKGGRMTGKTDAQAAAQEAWEEAGVEGEMSPEPVGAFRYEKTLKRRASRWLTVHVYAMRVTGELDAWPEQAERERRWFGQVQAATLVDEPDLQALISTFQR